MMKKYHALDEDGMARIGEMVGNGDVYINKHVPQVPEQQNGVLNQQELESLEFKP